jgi:hypothetical protein
MKDYTKESLEKGRPSTSALACIDFCLKCLYDDNKLVIEDTVGERLTIEELIGTLLKSRDDLIAFEKHTEWCDAQ